MRPKPVIIALGRPCIARGTGSSNTFPSSGESAANSAIGSACGVDNHDPLTRDRGFESSSLQRGVREPSVPLAAHGQPRGTGRDRLCRARLRCPRKAVSSPGRRDPGGSARICRGGAPGPLPCSRAHLFAVEGDTRITSVKPTPANGAASIRSSFLAPRWRGVDSNLRYRAVTGKPKSGELFCRRGTDGSNPSSSSKESANHRFHGGRADRSHKNPSRLEEITDTVTEAHGSAPRTSRHIPLRADYLQRERRFRPEGWKACARLTAHSSRCGESGSTALPAGFSRERRSVHPAARANSSKNAMS